MPTDDPIIQYSVKELLSNLQTSVDSGFAATRASLETKADKSQVEAINRRLDDHGREIGKLKDRQREDEAATSALSTARQARGAWRQWAISNAPGFTLALIAVVTLLIQH